MVFYKKNIELTKNSVSEFIFSNRPKRLGQRFIS